MTTEKTFFSYSRTDSEFVLKLAKDLRNAGVQIWLDQLDIKGGSHWDSAIETALNSSPNLIAVLSSESVKSNNVMDEISFALESGKTVIPVLLQECNVPFRLRRLQRIDFTGDYQTALNQLLEVIGRTNAQESPAANQVEAKENTTSPNEKSTIVSEKPSTEKTREYSNKPTATENKLSYSEKTNTNNGSTETKAGNSFNKKYLLIGVAAIVIIGLIIWLLAGSKSNESHIASEQSDSSQTSDTDSENTSQGSSEPKELNIGDEFEGGYVFYIDSTGEHGLIAAIKDHDVKSSHDRGKEFCKELETVLANYEANGYEDWRLPTMEELNLLYDNKEKIPGLNLTGKLDNQERLGVYVADPINPDCSADCKKFVDGAEDNFWLDRTLNYRLVRSF